MSEPMSSDILAHLTSARQGSEQSIGQLLDFFRGYLTVLARVQIDSQLRGKVDPSDLVQETFLEAHRDFPQFRGSTEPELMAWMRRIMARRVAKLVRRYYGSQRRNLRLEVDVHNTLDRSSQALARVFDAEQSSPSEQVMRRENAVRLADALERLPEHYRNVLILRHIEGMSFGAIATQLGRSLDSVKNIWSRALGRLREQLGEA